MWLILEGSCLGDDDDVFLVFFFLNSNTNLTNNKEMSHEFFIA